MDNTNGALDGVKWAPFWDPKSRKNSFFLAGVVPDSLDVVAVRVLGKGRVIARRVIPITGGTIVLGTRRQRCLVERPDLIR